MLRTFHDHCFAGKLECFLVFVLRRIKREAPKADVKFSWLEHSHQSKDKANMAEGGDPQVVFGVFTTDCFADVSAFNMAGFMDKGCLSFTISKLLGYVIIVGAFGLKLPQVQANPRPSSFLPLSLTETQQR